MNCFKWIRQNSRLMLFRQVLLAGGLGMGVSLFSPSALAATCTVSPVVSPAFAPYQGVTIDATGSITVRCTSLLDTNISYSISLSLGNQAVGTQRRMVMGVNFLKYNFFCTNGYSQVWADGLGGTCVINGGGLALVILPMVNTHTVYARIPGGQLVTAGTYNDNVNINVLY